jgi:hypothetical protein
MSDDLRARMRAVFAGKLSSGKGALQRYNADSVKETSRYSGLSVTHDLSRHINPVTRARAFSANRDSQSENTCAVCDAGGDLWHYGEVLAHQECARFLPKPDPAEPSAAYRAVTAEPDGIACKVEIVELPQAARYRKVFGVLQLRPPDLADVARWRQCVRGGSKFLARWGEQAERLGWDSRDLFGLHTPPERPHPSYSRLSRYNALGLIWLLEGREVIALTEATASIRNPKTGNVTVYRRFDKPGVGPVGDCLDGFV